MYVWAPLPPTECSKLLIEKMCRTVGTYVCTYICTCASEVFGSKFHNSRKEKIMTQLNPSCLLSIFCVDASEKFSPQIASN